MLAVLGKELRLYFTAPVFYALAAVFLVLSGYLFYTNLHFFVLFGAMDLVKGFWLFQFLDLRRLLIVLVPMLTMRLVAEERKLGTLELLWTYPLGDVAIVLGKFLAALLVLTVMLLVTTTHPLLLARVHAIDWGPVAAGYTGLVLLSAACVACGLFVSALTDSQLVAAAATYGLLLLFWVLTWNEAALSDGWLGWLAPLSLFDRTAVFAEGGIDTRDVVYFVLFTLAFLGGTLLVLESRRRRGSRRWLPVVAEAAAGLFVIACLQVVADRTNRRIDLTAGRALTLPAITRQVLGELQGPLTLTVFYDRGNRGRYAAVLKRLAAASPYVTTALYDLDRYPERARGMGVQDYGRAVVEYGSRRVVASAATEADLTGAILKVVRGRTRRVAYVLGHGERAPGGGGAGYGRLVAALEGENYELDPLAIEQMAVPAGTDVVVVAGPSRDFGSAALERLTTYLRAGGSVLLLLDPASLPALSAWLAERGVQLGDDVIVDRERRILATDGLAAVVEFFKQGNPITGSATSPIDTGVVLPSARTVSTLEGRPPGTAESIARTGDSAWAMRGAERARRGDEPSVAERDRQGPLDVMVMIEVPGADERTGRLVVVGDADFASDAYYDLLGNANLVLNAVAWLAREDVLAGEHEQQAPEVERPLSTLVLTEPQSRALLLAMVVVEPALVLALGVGVVGLRRWRG
jgi:ABC-2 type transport system permease protein